MPHNPETDAQVAISKQHHKMLKEIAQKQKRTIRGATEVLIEDASKKYKQST